MSNHECPLVSIVIPVYNGENYIRSAIDSAINQTYSNIEVIVVNDGSTDNTEEIVLSYGNKVRYYKKDNGGVATAVNFGVSKMKGEYFSWLSHDDYYSPNKIELQIKKLSENADCKLCFSNINVLHVNENKITKEDVLKYYDEEQIVNSCFAPIFFAVHGSTILVSKDLIDKVGGWDENLKTTQDSVWLFNAMRGRKSAFIRSQLVTVRIHDSMGQITMTEHNEEFNEMVINFCKVLSLDEKIELCGSEYNFYSLYYDVVHQTPKATYALDYLIGKMKILEKEVFENYFFNKSLKIAIFGMGYFGKMVFDTFESSFLEVDCFFDSNIEKVGTCYKNTRCYSIKDLLLEKEKYLVVVSINEPSALVEELKERGIPFVIDKDEACNVLYRIRNRL